MAKRAHGEGTIHKRHDGRWQGEVSLGYGANGTRKRKTVYGKTQAEVREKLDTIKRQVADGTFSDTKLSVKDYLNRWLELKAHSVKPRTVKTYRDAVRHIAPQIGKQQLAKVKPLDVQQLITHIATTTGTHSANYARLVLGMAMRHAVRLELLARNPVEAVARVAHTPRQQVIWTAEEAVKFLDTARAHRLYALFYLIMSTGLRHSEALNLLWDDIAGTTLTVRESKTAKGLRRVTLSDDVLAVLASHKQLQAAERHTLLLAGFTWPDTGLAFTTELGTQLDVCNVNRTRRILQANAGVRPATVHDMRHLNVSLRRKLGQDAKLIADQIGHTDPAFTTRLYTHLFEDDRQAAAVNLAAAFAGKPN